MKLDQSSLCFHPPQTNEETTKHSMHKISRINKVGVLKTSYVSRVGNDNESISMDDFRAFIFEPS